MSTAIGRLEGFGYRGTVTAGDGSNQTGGKMEAGYVNLWRKKEKAAEEGGMRRGGIQLEQSRTSGLCLGITQHPCDKTLALFARQPRC